MRAVTSIQFRQLFRLRIVFLFLWPGLAVAQPPNDNLADRVTLQRNDPPYQSNTIEATVEWSCVDESLTGQCIEYHNDQWFGFTPRQGSSVFLNLISQACRDVRGIQVVVFLGTPCQPETYEPILCYSTGTQSDIYLKLDSLIVGQEYLINIDGYLEDYCHFSIQLSNVSMGRPAIPQRNPVLQPPKVRDAVVILGWELPDTYGEEVECFEVERRLVTAGRVGKSERVAIHVNSRAEVLREYYLIDTLPGDGAYEYEIWAIRSGGEPLWLGKQQARPQKYSTKWSVPLYFPEHSAVQLILWDALTNTVLRNTWWTQGKVPGFWEYTPAMGQGLKLEVLTPMGEVLQTYYFTDQ